MKILTKAGYFLLCFSVFGRIKPLSNPGPDFIVIGAMKSGTTTLYNCLIQHPDILSAMKKEIHYFDRPHNFKKGIDWYNSQFPEKRQSFITGEATPALLFFEDAPKKVKESFPNIKLIAILRDPVARAFSHYKDVLHGTNQIDAPQKNVEKESFEMALKLEETRIKINTRTAHKFSYFGRGKYSDQLKNWFKFFPKEQFHIIIFEEFIADPEKHLNEVFKFLGLPEHKILSYENQNPSRLPNLTMNPETASELKQLYSPYNKELSTLLGRELPW